MVAKLIKSGDTLKQEFTAWDCAIIHATLGIVGELGELLGGIEYAFANAVKLDVANILEELGDLEFFLENFRATAGITRDEVLNCETVCQRPTNAVRQCAHMLVYGTDLMDHVKKAVIYRKPINREAIIVNLSKIEYILVWLYPLFELTREQALEANMDKLAKRYDGFQYTDQRAQDRADKPEEKNNSTIIIPHTKIIRGF